MLAETLLRILTFDRSFLCTVPLYIGKIGRDTCHSRSHRNTITIWKPEQGYWKGFLKGLSHEIDFKNVDENGQILALTRAAAGFWIFRRLLWFLIEIKHQFPGKC